MIFKHNGNGNNRKDTPQSIKRKIELETEARVRYLSLRGPGDINKRLRELDVEWDIERTLLLNTGTVVLSGVLLAALSNKKWLILPGVAAAFLVQHSLLGWSPPVFILRGIGIRTKSEIERERMALKAIRGDFKEAADEKDDLKRADKALKAVGVSPK